MRHSKKQESIIHTQEKKSVKRNCPRGRQMLDLLNKDFKLTILNIFKEPQDMTLKEKNENDVLPNRNINKNIDILSYHNTNRNAGVEKYNN